MRKILIHLFQHFILSLLVGAFSWWVAKSWWWVVIGMAVNIFMDLDHVLEYVAWAHCFHLREFLLGRYFKEKGSIMVIFHGWEYVILALVLWGVTGFNGWLILAVAMGSHLLFDQLSWNLYPLAYFIIYRVKNDFAIAKICRDVAVDNSK